MTSASGARRPTRPDGLSREAYDALRAAVLRFKEVESRRVFPPVVHVGHPVRGDADFVDRPGLALDLALRTDVVAALLARGRLRMRRPLCWLTRQGTLEPTEADLWWLAAARAAYGEAGVPLPMVVVTRSGWFDPRTDQRVEWRRLRG